MTHQDILIAGVGGQGILTVARALRAEALERGLHGKQSVVHGMAQRGAAVGSHVRLSGRPLASDLIARGRIHLLLVMEAMERLRVLPYARTDAVFVANSAPVRDLPDYPDPHRLLELICLWPNHRIPDAEALVHKAGTVRAVNSRKGRAAVEKNLRAFDLGRAAAEFPEPVPLE